VKLRKTQKLAKFIAYVLGRRPDEFGLIPQKNGFFNIKEVLKALHEQEGWRYVRLGHLNEVAMAVSPAPVEIEGNRIRARNREKLPLITDITHTPKLLYLAIRRKAYPAVIEKGLAVGGRPPLVMSSDEKMARRIGLRRDQHPVMLTIHVAKSLQHGTRLKQYGDHLFLADAIYPDTFSGPALPKEKPNRIQSKTPPEPAAPKTPGSYFPDLSQSPESKSLRRKEIEWKKDRRKARKHKSRQQS
jgi:putative RNA 2'-phosphotransferase